MPHRLNDWAPKTLVKVTFGREPDTGEIDHLAPFLVTDRSGAHVGVYEDEPNVVAEAEASTRVAFFEAQWVEDHWVFGHRVDDQDW
jgi:hypothetical protein